MTRRCICDFLSNLTKTRFTMMYIQLSNGKEPTKLQLIFIFDLSLSIRKQEALHRSSGDLAVLILDTMHVTLRFLTVVADKHKGFILGLVLFVSFKIFNLAQRNPVHVQHSS